MNKRKADAPNISTAQLYNHFLALHEHDNYDNVENDVNAYLNDYDGSDLDIHVFDQLNVDITIEEILYAIGQLKSCKSAGEDMLLNEMFVHGKKYTCTQYMCNI